MKKSILKIMICFMAAIMVLSSFVAISAIADETVYDGSSVSESLQGEGTEASPYLIANGADLKYFEQNAKATTGKYYKLTADIIWSNYKNGDATPTASNWTPIDDFYGTFDGNGHYVAGICVVSDAKYTGFFATANGEIKNFTLKDSYISGSVRVGGIVGTLHTSNNPETPGTLNITNCVNYATVVANSGSDDIDGVGGIMGAFMCNSGEKEGTTATYVTGTISDCVNYGEISTTGDKNGYVAGIAGRLIGFPANIINCANFGNITSPKAIAGGICGQVSFKVDRGGISTVSNCLNTGIVSATHVVGGITGRAYLTKNSNESTSSTIVTNCVNIGTVKAAAKSADNAPKYGSIDSGNGATYFNNYYLENSSSNSKKDVAGAGNVAAVGTSKTAAEINSADMVAALGDKWELKDNALTLKVVATAGTVEAEPEEEVTTPEATESETEFIPVPPTNDSGVIAYVIIVAVALLMIISVGSVLVIKKEHKN